MMDRKGRYTIGIDVGTGSARAGIFDLTGRMVASSSHEIELWRPETDFVEQSSDNIWQACGKAVREAMEASKGCHVDITLKDVQTVEYHPENLKEWVRIVRDVSDEYA